MSVGGADTQFGPMMFLDFTLPSGLLVLEHAEAFAQPWNSTAAQ